MYLVKAGNNSSQGKRRLTWYLAMEEYVASHIMELVPSSSEGVREAFFTWQAPPAVIFGRNQVMEAEVNIGFCRDKGIDIVRRKSGGGCVYSDMGNIMMSYICDQSGVEAVFNRYLERIVSVLRSLGINAISSGRNDIMVDGRKISGNAFEILPHSSIVHGTLLFDVDMDSLESAITPSAAKISSKGVSSVRQHIANLSEFIKGVDASSIRSSLETALCRYSINLDEGASNEIEEIERSYLDEDFIKGKKHLYSEEKHFIIKGIGEFQINIEKDGNAIRSFCLMGDYFSTSDPQDEIEKRLKGVQDEKDSVRESLNGFDLGDYIPGLSTETFINELYDF